MSVRSQEYATRVINDCTKSYVNVRGRGCAINLEVASMATTCDIPGSGVSGCVVTEVLLELETAAEDPQQQAVGSRARQFREP